jgi:predicted enzyme related to lactoylglutathione lyase
MLKRERKAQSLRRRQPGGEVFTEPWEGPGFRVCNACDPEGNIFQVRESASPDSMEA